MIGRCQPSINLTDDLTCLVKSPSRYKRTFIHNNFNIIAVLEVNQSVTVSQNGLFGLN